MKKELLQVHEALEKEKREKSEAKNETENVKELLKVQKALEDEKVTELHRNDRRWIDKERL